MGKKTWDELDNYKQEKKLQEMGNLVGIDRGDYRRYESESGRYPNTKGSYEDYERDVLSAMNNNYDIRTAMMHTEGDGPNAINKASEGYDVYKSMKQAHKDAGNSGSFSSANDLAGVSTKAYAESRDRFKSKILDDMPQDEEQTETAVEPATMTMPENPDSTLSDSIGRVDANEGSIRGGNSFGAEELRGNYTLNLKQGMKKAGVPTRGPGAVGTPGGFKS